MTVEAAVPICSSRNTAPTMMSSLRLRLYSAYTEDMTRSRRLCGPGQRAEADLLVPLGIVGARPQSEKLRQVDRWTRSLVHHADLQRYDLESEPCVAVRRAKEASVKQTGDGGLDNAAARSA
jgi:hypothetical protein